MPNIKIVSDSNCDLSPAQLAEYGIDLVPFYINLGEHSLLDGINVTSDDIYAFVARTGILPGTVARSIEDFKDVFAKWRGKGYEVLCHTISSSMSCNFQNARLAAEEVGGVAMVDTRNLSSGSGHVVLQSAIMARQGLSVYEICKRLEEEIIPNVRASFILDNLEYMRKGGRCSSVALLGANLLKIRPEIVVDKGEMKVGRKFRGPYQKVLEEYVDSRLANTSSLRTDRIFITHSGCTPDVVDCVRARIEKHIHFDEIVETRASGTITSHCGPNTLGILYIEKP